MEKLDGCKNERQNNVQYCWKNGWLQVFCEYPWKNAINSILIHEYQPNSTRINTSPTRINTSQHESTRVRNESTQVSKSKKVKESSRRVNANQQKSDISLTRIWESITNCRNISHEVFIYDFSFLVQFLYCIWQLRYRHIFCVGW